MLSCQQCTGDGKQLFVVDVLCSLGTEIDFAVYDWSVTFFFIHAHGVHVTNQAT